MNRDAFIQGYLHKIAEDPISSKKDWTLVPKEQPPLAGVSKDDKGKTWYSPEQDVSQFYKDKPGGWAAASARANKVWYGQKPWKDNPSYFPKNDGRFVKGGPVSPVDMMRTVSQRVPITQISKYPGSAYVPSSNSIIIPSMSSDSTAIPQYFDKEVDEFENSLPKNMSPYALPTRDMVRHEGIHATQIPNELQPYLLDYANTLGKKAPSIETILKEKQPGVISPYKLEDVLTKDHLGLKYRDYPFYHNSPDEWQQGVQSTVRAINYHNRGGNQIETPEDFKEAIQPILSSPDEDSFEKAVSPIPVESSRWLRGVWRMLNKKSEWQDNESLKQQGKKYEDIPGYNDAARLAPGFVFNLKNSILNNS